VYKRQALTSADADKEVMLRRKLGRVLELRGDFDAALAELTRAAVPGTAEYGRALNGIGNVCKRSGRHREAVTYYCRAVRNAAGPMDHGRALGNLADTLRVMGHDGIAEPIFDAGEALGRQVDDVVGLAILAGNRCILVEEQGRSELAVQLAREATDRFEELGFVAPSLTVQQVVIRGLIVMGELSDAREALAAAEAQARVTGMELISCELRIVGALLLVAEARTDAAMAEFEGVIAEAGRLGAAPLATRAYNELGQLLVAKGRRDEARTAFDSAMLLAQANGDRVELVKAQRALADLAGALDSR
jgi:tetratricopeptide (TPR) repeat protein